MKYSVKNAEPVDFKEFIYLLKSESRGRPENNHVDQFGLYSLSDDLGSGRRIEEKQMVYLSLPTLNNSLASLYEVIRSE